MGKRNRRISSRADELSVSIKLQHVVVIFVFAFRSEKGNLNSFASFNRLFWIQSTQQNLHFIFFFLPPEQPIIFMLLNWGVCRRLLSFRSKYKYIFFFFFTIPDWNHQINMIEMKYYTHDRSFQNFIVFSCLSFDVFCLMFSFVWISADLIPRKHKKRREKQIWNLSSILLRRLQSVAFLKFIFWLRLVFNANERKEKPKKKCDSIVSGLVFSKRCNQNQPFRTHLSVIGRLNTLNDSTVYSSI